MPGPERAQMKVPAALNAIATASASHGSAGSARRQASYVHGSPAVGPPASTDANSTTGTRAGSAPRAPHTRPNNQALQAQAASVTTAKPAAKAGSSARKPFHSPTAAPPFG